MRHRGPDGRGTLEYEGGAAGMVRLALVDLSARGQQPIWSADRRVAILFNGEMYNHREERSRLAASGHGFRSTTDTEVVLALYLERGPSFLDRVRGMYGLAVFDWRDTSPGALPALLLARDPLGIKPLYIARRHEGSGVIFASECRALVASGLVEPEVSREALADYLAHGFLLQPRTIFAGVRMLDAGTMERYWPAQPAERVRFWRRPSFRPRQESLDEAAERLRETLEESVALHSMADAPVGAFLSGGVDSSGIVGLMRRRIPDLRTYTLRYPDLPGHDESNEAISGARHFGCRNTVVDVTGMEVRDLLPQFASSLDQPSADGLNTWIISRAAARDVKGVLSGLGGDEFFAGYPVTRRMARYAADSSLSGRAQAVAGQLAHSLGRFMPESHLRTRFDNLAARRSALAVWIQGHTVFPHRYACQLAGVETGHEPQEERFGHLLDEIDPSWRDESPVGLSGLLDVRVYMGSQLLRDSDATSMAHSLELRVPLVDIQIARFSRSCSDQFKLAPRGGGGLEYDVSGAKRVLVHALRDLLPAGTGQRPKRGFALPIDRWLRSTLRELVDETCHPETVARRGLIDPALIEPLYRRRGEDAPGTLYPRLWSLMVLELWCRATLDSPNARTATSRSAVS